MSQEEKIDWMIVDYPNEQRQVRRALLPEKISNPNCDTESAPGITLLNQLLIAKDYESATKLIKVHGADVNLADWNKSNICGGKASQITPLMCAVGCASSLTIDNGCLDIFSSGEKVSDLDMIGTLLKHGANPNAQDGIGMTPLHYIVNNNKYKNEDDKLAIAQLLVSSGADISISSAEHGTPAELARKIGMDTCFPRVMKLVTRKK